MARWQKDYDDPRMYRDPEIDPDNHWIIYRQMRAGLIGVPQGKAARGLNMAQLLERYSHRYNGVVAAVARAPHRYA